MLLDATNIPADSLLQVALCIIGAGPVGITIARQLAGSGVDVILIESGAERHTKQAGDFLRGRSVGYPSHTDRTRQRGYGGTSNHWTNSGLRARPLDPIDFEARPEVPDSGWPLTYGELVPYFRRAQDALGLGPYEYATEAWEDAESAPRIPFASTDVQTGMFQFGPRDHFMKTYDEVASAPHVQLLLNSTVVELATTTDGSALDHVRVAGPDGRRFSVRARAYVLAGGGIENARILLASRSTRSAGLGNEHDLVGRYYMEHISTDSGFFWPTDPTLLGRLKLYAEHWSASGTKLQGFLKLSPEVLRRERLLNAGFWVMPGRADWTSAGVTSLRALMSGSRRRPWIGDTARHAFNIARDADDVARWTYRYLRHDSQSGHQVVRLRFMAEQAPNPHSRVTLDERDVDAVGMPRVRLDWRLTERDRYSVRRSQELIGQAFAHSGLGQLRGKLGDESPPALLVGNAHHMGTTRMHDDPKRGVVDSDLRMHSVPNLFVGGSSVFPTGGFANPTHTLVALAIRLADHLRSELGERDSGATVTAFGATAGV